MEIEIINQNTKPVADFLINHPTLNAENPNVVISTVGRYGNAKVEITSCPGALTRFSDGFLSYPTTWWTNHIHAAMLLGYFGKKQRMVAQLRQNILGVILNEAINNFDKTLQVIEFYAKNKLSSDKAGAIGRLLGGVFTNYATTRIPGMKKNPFSKKTITGIKMANFIVASYGAAIFAIAKGSRKFEDIISMIITGNYEATACINMSGFKYVKNVEVKYNHDDFVFFMSVLQEVDKLNQKNRNYFIRIEEDKL